MTVEEKIALYEKEEKFDVDINDDPEAPVLLAKDADYYCKKFKNKVNRKIANFIADHYFLKLIKKDIIKIDKEYRFRCFAGFFNNLCTVFEQTVDLFVCIIKAMLEVARSAYKLINRSTSQLVRIAALACQIGIETLLHDVAVFAVMQVAQICIVQLFLKEFDYTVLCFAFAIANVGHKRTSFTTSHVP